MVRKNICEQAHKYLKSQAEKTYGTSNVLVHNKGNVDLLDNWSEYFMDPPQNLTFGMQYADTALLGEDYPPKEMKDFLKQF